MGRRLTELEYQSRRIKLGQHIDAAKVSHRDAAFKHEIGEGDEATVIAAKASISALEDRVVGLDAAWERAKQEAAVERADQDARERAVVVSKVSSHLKARTAAARHLSKLAKEIGETWQKFEAAGEGVMDAARPYGKDLGVEGFRQLRDLLLGDFHSVKPSLGGEMVDAGLKLTSNDFPGAHLRSGDRGVGLVAFTEKRNGIAADLVASLLEVKE